MNDDELTALAAKAAGMKLTDGFKPLTNGGDALRLAVKLRHFRVGLGECIGRGAYSHIAILESGPDPDAATRRAIVRAAAELGRSKT